MSRMNDEDFDLEAMRLAVNYRRSIINMIAAAELGDLPIDLGAGDGSIAEEIRQKTMKSPLCIEISPSLRAAILKKKLTLLETGDTAFSATGLYSINVLEHIKDDIDVLKRHVSTLPPGARVFIYVPALMALYGPWDSRVGHIRRYNRSTLLDVASKSGLHVEKIRYADSLGGMIAFVMRCAGGGSKPLSKKTVWLYDRLIFPLSIILDFFTSRFFGKNIYMVARK